MIFPSFLQRGIGNLDKMRNIIENWTQSLMTSHIQSVLIGVKYQNCRQTLDVYLCFAAWIWKIQSKA